MATQVKVSQSLIDLRRVLSSMAHTSVQMPAVAVETEYSERVPLPFVQRNRSGLGNMPVNPLS